MSEVREVGGFKWFVPDEPYRNLPLDDWEVLERLWVRDNTPAGGVFLDIGANSGIYSIFLASHFDDVVAIEPDEMNVRVLRENMKLNRIENIKILQVAAWSEGRMISYHQVIEGDTSSAAVAWDGPHPYLPPIKTTKVQAIRVDSLDMDPAVVKIDVEGAELHVLLGAIQTIRRCRPVMLLELHDVKHMEFANTLMDLLGYELLNPEHFKPLRVLVYRHKEG
jgi:FkbM family methyltransferase